MLSVILLAIFSFLILYGVAFLIGWYGARWCVTKYPPWRKPFVHSPDLLEKDK